VLYRTYSITIPYFFPRVCAQDWKLCQSSVKKKKSANMSTANEYNVSDADNTGRKKTQRKKIHSNSRDVDDDAATGERAYSANPQTGGRHECELAPPRRHCRMLQHFFINNAFALLRRRPYRLVTVAAAAAAAQLPSLPSPAAEAERSSRKQAKQLTSTTE